MRMTVDAMKSVAKDILRLYGYEISKASKNGKSAEAEINIDIEKDNFESLASAFMMLGLMSQEDFMEIKKTKIKKSEVDEIHNKKEWMCAVSKTDLPMPFIVK